MDHWKYLAVTVVSGYGAVYVLGSALYLAGFPESGRLLGAFGGGVALLVSLTSGLRTLFDEAHI